MTKYVGLRKLRNINDTETEVKIFETFYINRSDFDQLKKELEELIYKYRI